MAKEYFVDQTFEELDGQKSLLAPGTYEACTFKKCHMSGADLSDFSFIECEFVDSDLSNAKVRATSFRDVVFDQCKLMGLHLEDANPLLFSATFRHTQLDFSSFYQRKMPQTLFSHCSLKEVDFTEADLTQAIFEACDLEGAIFEYTVLKKADFSTAQNFVIDPEINPIQKARFSAADLGGLLKKYDIIVK